MYCDYMYIYIYIYIAFLVSRARYLPSVSLFHPLTVISVQFFLCLSFRLIFPLPQISLSLSLRTSSVLSEHVLLALTSPVLPSSANPILQLALRSVLLSHFVFKVRLSLSNNIILSLDTSPCEDGQRLRRHDRQASRSCPPDASILDERLLLFFLFLLIPLFAYTAN